jgi:hypothetical protein
MFFGSLILIIAILISAIAAYYSVVGLTAIFAAAVLPVMIMGGALKGKHTLPLVTCPHCGLEGRSNMQRWHFDNCKKKKL